MPQISQLAATYASQVFWLLIFFGLTYFVIGRMMVPRVEGVVKKRDDQISADIDAAITARERAEALEEEWRKDMADARSTARAELNKAKDAAAADTSAKLAAAEAEIAAEVDAAEAALEARKAEAMSHLEEVAVEAAQQAVEKVSGLSIERDTAATKVREVIAHG